MIIPFIALAVVALLMYLILLLNPTTVKRIIIGLLMIGGIFTVLSVYTWFTEPHEAVVIYSLPAIFFMSFAGIIALINAIKNRRK